MKKAKIMLTAVGLLAVAGGALAFKAHRFTGTLLCKTTTTHTVCTISATTQGNRTTTIYCVNNPDGEQTLPCPSTSNIPTSFVRSVQ
jgi:hypothetical protein